jgi:hypothetical protein
MSVDKVTGLPRQRLVGAAVRGLQRSARCFLTEEHVCAVVGVFVHKCSWAGDGFRHVRDEAAEVAIPSVRNRLTSSIFSFV